MERDPTVAYSIEADVIDTFSRAFTSTPGLIPVLDPDQRPPSSGRVLPDGPVAMAEARTLADGVVRFSSSILTAEQAADPSSLDCADNDWRSSSTPPGPVATDFSPVYPLGIYDPDYSRRYSTRIPMPVAGALWVCAWIYPDDNPLTPIAVDGLLFRAPTAQRPRIVLQGIRRLGDETISSLRIRASREVAAGSVDRCSGGWDGTDLAPGATLSVEATIWECTDALLELDADGTVAVPVVLQRRLSSDTLTEEIAISMSPDDCSAGPCEARPREWYEVPIPSGSRRMCGTGFGGGGCDATDAAGIAVIRVDYPVVEGAAERLGEVTLLDQVDTEARGAEPSFTSPELTFLPGSDPFVRTGRLSFFTDRPMRMGAQFGDLSVVDARACFEGEAVVPLSTDFDQEFSFDIAGFCSGNSYQLALRGVDEDGTEWEWNVLSGYTAPAVSNDIDVEVDFLGGEGRETHGFFHRFGVEVEGQSTTAYWYEFSGSRGTGSSCWELDGTTARSRGYHPPIYFQPNEFTVRVNYDITTTGEGDCSGSGATGYDPNEFTASFSVDDLRAGTPLVVESPASSPLAMRITLTPGPRWRHG